MTVATSRRMSLEEYLTYDDGTEARYELVDGVLVEMGAESTINTLIASFLFSTFLGLGVPFYRIGMKQKIEVDSQYASARDPDLIVHTAGSFAAIAGLSEACLKRHDANPLLVIEVVSPGTESSDNYKRDYEQKPKEYAARGIPEYWLIDPVRKVVLVLTLAGGEYQEATFTGKQVIQSPTFTNLTLTAIAMLTAGE